MSRVARPPDLRAAIAPVLLALVLVATACAPATRGSESAAFAGGVDRSESDRIPAAHPSLWMPVAGVRVGELHSNFGAARGGRIHEGIDIMAPRGTPVHSALDGVVRFAGHTPLGGWTVWVHGGGMDVWYAHLDGIAAGVTKGARVTPHTLLGGVGDTGNAAGGSPHLHFEVVTSSGPVDPLPLLRDRP